LHSFQLQTLASSDMLAKNHVPKYIQAAMYFVSPYSPPLGRDLYVELENFASNMMSQINKKIGRKNISDFETKMHEIWKGKINLVLFNSMLAVYFSRFQPSNKSNTFIELLNSMKGKNLDFIFSTLNYDCIAEYAAYHSGFKVNYDYKNQKKNEFNILKLHGSCNFVMSGMTGPLGGLSMPSQAGVLQGPMSAIWPPINMQTEIKKYPAGPIMSFYMKNKPTQVNSNTLNEIQQAWKNRILESSKLLIIGINPNPEDKHVWDPIEKTKAKIGFVGSTSGFKKLNKIKLQKKPEHLSASFDSSINDIENFLT